MSNMSALGFPVETEEQFIALALQAAEKGTPMGPYVQWRPADGIELWAQVVDDNEVCGMNPHFSGPARLRMRLDTRIHEAEDPPLDGAFLGWVEPDGDGQGQYPLCFDSPEARRLDGAELPRTAEVQIAAFAHEIETWPSVEEYEAAQDKEGSLAARSFIPAGLFNPEEGSRSRPRPIGLITGVVQNARRLRNPVTGRGIHHFHVDSYAGEYDVLAPEEMVPDPPGRGGVVQGMFWLSGRVVAWYP